MNTKIVNGVKYACFFALILVSVIACERDFEDVGVRLVDNDLFTPGNVVFDIVAYNKDIDSSRVNQNTATAQSGTVNGLTQYLLGVYKDPNFGLLKASFVSQLGLPTNTDFGDNVTIDSIILDIPYTATDTSSTTTTDFELENIIGDVDAEFTLSVYRLGTFLNTLDPEDPTKNKRYYSDEEYEKEELLYSGLFKPERNDTALFIKRDFLYPDKDTLVIDTILKNPLSPSIKLPLDEAFFKNNFVDQQNSGVFSSFDIFSDYFRGIIIEADDTEGSLMTLTMSNATIAIYYTNDILTDETDEDLNGDDDTDDTDVPVKTKQTKTFSLGGIRASTYTRDYSGVPVNDATLNPNTVEGSERLYVQGASGTISILELFNGIDADSIQRIREKDWLINEANIILYADDDISQTNLPERLFLYRYDSNSQILDVLTENQSFPFEGVLDTTNSENKYKFRITDYISEVLKRDEPINFERLGLKVYHPTDVPSTLNDTIIKDFSWIARGAVLKGNNPPLVNGEKDPERLKLEIFYTVNNE